MKSICGMGYGSVPVVVNSSLRKKIVPIFLKMDLAHCLLKNTIMNIFNPLSNLSFLEKVVEKVAANQC